MMLSASMFPSGPPYTFTPADVDHVEQDLREALGDQYLQSEQVGSSYVMGSGNDLDIVVRVHDLDDAALLLDDAGFACNSKDYADSTDMFKCLRKGLVNVMLVNDAEWYDKFVLSSEVCKALRLEEKWQRISVHRVIMDGEDAETAVATAKGLRT